ncbi:heparan-alpha-glucosaminide N-acetyltransferase domain-containing protein [Gaetbulibacter saemankumensis]|uniref:heparan-alpha-glucosaminide N-acetyltransferase domain-containing protein n=1 Tax=Gaetbulibacter saemankumensis TaxID=311208 RepID=UPI0004156D12|nr:heparan-alpha-glucosaminide N-acetyltransferase domain-containing protein [Gaetbulibacter saemankumensis]
MQVQRLYFIDAVRAFAILMMLQGHFIDTLINPIYRIEGNMLYDIWTYFRGITAPTFFTISGLVFAYLLLRAHEKGNDRERLKRGLFRGLLLILIGYSLRINILRWLSGHFSSYVLVVDVLQCIGLSLILLIGLHSLLKKHSYIYSAVLLVIGCLCFISEPIYRNLAFTNVPLVFANYMTKANGSVFTILPWFGYTVLGAFISTVFFRHSHRTKFKHLTIITFFIVGYILIYHSTWGLTILYNWTHWDLLIQCANFNYLFIRLGNVFVLFGLFYTFEHYLKHSIITKIGKKTLSIYVIHFILLYGSFTGYGLKRLWNKSLDPAEVIIGALFFILMVCFISFHYAKTNHFIYSIMHKIITKFKR